MGQQLDLFADYGARLFEPGAELPSDPGEREQLGLFEDRVLLLSRARAALAEALPDVALEEAASLRRRYPNDPVIAGEAAAVESVAGRLHKALDEPPAARAEAILDVAFDASGRRLVEEVRRALAARAARTAIQEVGDRALLRRALPARWLLEAGLLDEAHASAARAVAAQRTAPSLAVLADVAFAEGRKDESRRHYLDALLLDPHGVCFEDVRDDAVRELPDVARHDLEIDDDPVAWSAAVGVVTGVFLTPLLVESAWQVPGEADAPAPAGRRALDAARRFVQLHRTATSTRTGDPESVVEARREMMRLSPSLFGAFMRRLGAPS